MGDRKMSERTKVVAVVTFLYQLVFWLSQPSLAQPIRSLPLDSAIPTSDSSYVPIALTSPITTRRTTVGNIRSGLTPTSRTITCTAPLLCAGTTSTTLAADFTLSLNSSVYRGGRSRVSTQFDKTGNTTLSDVTGLSVTVTAGSTYGLKGVLFLTSGSSGGVKVAIAGTATATSIVYDGLLFSNGTISAQTRVTSLGSTVCAATAVLTTQCQIEGTITVNAGGTLTIQFAQNASNGTTSSVLVGSRFYVDGPL